MATLGDVRIDSGPDPEPPTPVPEGRKVRIPKLTDQLSPEDQRTLREFDQRDGTGIYQAVTPKPKSRAAAGVDAESAFAEFWAAYPRKKAKERARKAFAAARERGVDAATLINGAKRYAAQRVAEEPTDLVKRERYTLYPATWLNDGAWDDEFPSGGNGALIDQDGNRVPEPPPPPRSWRPMTFAEAADEMHAEGDDWGPQ